MTRVNRSSFYYSKKQLTKKACESKQYERTSYLRTHFVNIQKEPSSHSWRTYLAATTPSRVLYKLVKDSTSLTGKRPFKYSKQQAAQC